MPGRDYAYPLRVAADKYPERTIFICRDERWSFRDFDRATDRLAAAFEARGLTGQGVALLLQNEPLTVMTMLALARAGAVSVPVNPRLLADELAFVVDDAGAVAIVADDAFAAAAGELHARCAAVEQLFSVDDVAALLETEGSPVTEVDRDAAAMMVYTSGTTGFPKGVVRTHDANLWATVNAALGQPRSSADTEVFVLPLFGIAFIFQVMPLILQGGTVVLDGAFDAARTWELLERHRATRVFLAPTMLDTMLALQGHESRDVSSLHTLNTAYEFPEAVRRLTQERFGDIVHYMYGLSEAQLCCSEENEFAADPTNAGHAQGMMRVKAVDENREALPPGVVGEIAMEGPSLMTGYHNRDEDTIAAGWLYTGDLGYVDESGRVHMTGRQKEMIKTGGFSVDPIEVEKAILGFPGVREAAVVGAPDEHWGEVVVAFVAGSELTENELLAFVKSRLTGFKCPKRVAFLESLPKNPTGKIERGRLRELASEQH
jgi:acyl-CoA synthetase (AMP-forming)/AMP-acid ligase II